MAEELEVGVLLTARDEGMTDALVQARDAAKELTSQVERSSKALITAGAIVGASAFAIYKFGKQSFSAAARVSELNVSIKAIGKATGVGADAINKAAKAVASQGIEMAAAQGIAIEYAQANLNLADASKVARVAQDLAVISQRNSTQVAQLLTRAIRTGNSQLLKSAGVSRMAGEGYALYAAQLGKSATALSATERQQAIINLVLDEGRRVAGVYEASMTEAGKVLRSFPRLMNDIQVAFGTAVLQGFGPLIKAGYDAFNAFTKLFKEGGALAPVITELGIAMQKVFQPITDSIKKLGDFFKGLQNTSISVSGLGDRLAKAAPAALGFATAISGLAGRQLLGLNKFTAAFAKFLPGVSSGFFILAALTPRVREAITRLTGAFIQFLPALMAISDAIMGAVQGAVDTFGGTLEALAGVVEGLASVLLPMFNGLAAVITTLEKPLQGLVILFAVKWVAGQIASAAATARTAMAAAQAGESVGMFARAGMFATRVYSNFSFTLQTTGSVMTAFSGTTVAAMGAAKGAVVSFLASVAPMLALTAAIWLVMAAINKAGEADRRRAAVTKEVTVIIKEQVNALAKTNEALSEYLSNTNALDTAIMSNAENGDKLTRTFNRLGLDAENAFEVIRSYKTDSDAFVKGLAKQAGYSDDLAYAFSNVTDASENWHQINKESTKYMSMDSSRTWNAMHADITAAGGAAVQFKNSLYMLNQVLSDTDLLEYVKQTRVAAELKSKDAAAAYAHADALAADVAAQRGVTDELGKALIVQELASVKLAQMTKVQEEQRKAMLAMPPTIKNIEERLKGATAAAADGVFKWEELYDAMFGAGYSETIKQTDNLYKMRGALTSLNEQLKKGAKSFDTLNSSGVDLAKQIGENAAAMKKLQMSDAEIAGMTTALVNSFVATAESAGYSDEEIKKVIESLGLINGYRTVAMVDADISAFEEKLRIALSMMSLLDGESRQQAADIQGQLYALKQERIALEENAKKYATLSNKTGGASNATKEFTGRQKELRDAILKTVNDALEKEEEALGRLKGKLSALKDGLMTAVGGAGSLKDAFAEASQKAQEFNDRLEQLRQEKQSYIESVAGSVKQTLALSDAFGQFQQSTQRVKDAEAALSVVQQERAAAQAEMTVLMERENLLMGMVYDSTKRFARSDVVAAIAQNREDASKAAERLSNAEQALGMAMGEVNAAGQAQLGFLDALRKQVSEAREFGNVIQQLTQMGLSRDALQQIVSAGAVAGTQMGKELIAGGQASVDETNRLFTEIGTIAQQSGDLLGDKFYQIGDKMGLSLGDALVSRAQKAREFVDKIKQLTAMGLSPENIIDVINAGVEAGTVIADELIRGGADAINQANQIQSELENLARGLGEQLGSQFFDTGITLGEQIVAGLQRELKRVQDALEKAQTIPQLEALLGKTQGKVTKITGKPAPTITKPTVQVPTLPIVQAASTVVPRFATGGIVTRPTLGLIGEAGPEAVIPLSQMGGGGAVYNVTVNAGMGSNGAQIGDAIVEALQKYERRNGSVPIRTS